MSEDLASLLYNIIMVLDDLEPENWRGDSASAGLFNQLTNLKAKMQEDEEE